MDTSHYYYSKLSALNPLVLCLTLFIFSAAVFGQIEFDKFPMYGDLFLSLIIPAISIYALFGLTNLFFKIEVHPKYIHCYTNLGPYETVAWDEIESVYAHKLIGLKYIVVEHQNSSAMLTVPIFLNDIDSFKSNIEKYAGKNHLLSEVLRNET